jgi:hypothetical protein
MGTEDYPFKKGFDKLQKKTILLLGYFGKKEELLVG